jgi:hypothetical protein
LNKQVYGGCSLITLCINPTALKGGIFMAVSRQIHL